MTIVIRKSNGTALVLLAPKEIRLKLWDYKWSIVVEDDFRTECIRFDSRGDAENELSRVLYEIENGAKTITLSE